MSQPFSNIVPTISSVPWATPDATSSMDMPGDRPGCAPGRLRVPSADLSGPTLPGTQYADVAAIFVDGSHNSSKPIENPLVKAALWVGVFGVFFPPIAVSVVLVVIVLVQAQNLPGRVGVREAIAAFAFDSILISGTVVFYLIGFSGLFQGVRAAL